MPLSNIANLFGRSPIKPIEKHMATAHEASADLVPFFEALMRGDLTEAEIVQQRISAAENRADDIKKDLRLHLPDSLFMPVSRSDLLVLLHAQDEVANTAQDIAGLAIGRKMQIPAPLQPLMKTFVDSAVATSAQALRAINELDELLESGFAGREVDIVRRMIEELDELERKSDKLEVEIRAALFAIEKDLPPVDVIFLYRIIEWVGDLADRALSVGNRLQLLLAR
ncbi:TIGR00153 family protein [Microbulbifer thermotolerans]|uniref:Phosphate transport regulator n=1 Tax=Microbulbifer thermotolerans TaxID=252514 RepID=A0A143HQH0_MICTH|nr:TIGR00153 family protein [Microbulbifer thermotolerans]AMX03532.1 phosphate transport regulator [Microbulbifer thermotolerans]MCX2778155.1 TIGR00153 family protein [Microbulbifer thermotolerans]MCX2801135.1 TIGR00153 family protein [Microbulbifer thermotolerans]MCX2804503.1 TIGR00153 family protein [Microbulbifer thermotolerans]MCX2831284.1 TIGR00153 family protein [Microbulbifer thermotolerans]